MASKFSTYLLSLILFISYFETVVPTVYLPVVLWNSSKNEKDIPALQRLGKDEFKDVIEESLKSNPYVVIFTEENLSTEDLSSSNALGSGVFDPLIEVIQGSGFKYFPAVQSPVRVLEDLSTKENFVRATITSNGHFVEPEPKPGHFCLLEFNDSESDVDRLHLLQKHVIFMTEVYKKLSKFGNVLAIYTAHHPSWYVPSVGTAGHNNRHLLQVNNYESEGNYQITNSSDIIFYVGSAPVLTHIDKGVEIKYDLNELSYRSELTDEVVTLEAESVNITFRVNFTKFAGYWYMHSVHIVKSIYDINNELLLVKNVYAPLTFSYHCSTFVAGNKTLALTFPEMQVQPNFLPNTLEKFGDAYDCVGFTTVPIWSGLFVTFILALIMILGLNMMMDIKTMDRFDDPKGKTITINVAEQ